MNVDGPAWPSAWRSEATRAMDTWSAVSPGTFRFDDDPSSTSHVASYDNGVWSGWMAMTWTAPRPQGSTLASAKIVINTHYEWSPPHPSEPHTDHAGAYDLETVLTHELGHALHLDEDFSGAPTMMRPTIGPGEVRRLHADDEQGLRHIYP
jgi:hypothetical protein